MKKSVIRGIVLMLFLASTFTVHELPTGNVHSYAAEAVNPITECITATHNPLFYC